MRGLRLVLRYAPSGKEGGGLRIPKGWQYTTLDLSHDVLGGVTNAIDKLWCANPITEEKINIESPEGLATNLCQVLQPAMELERFKWAAIPEEVDAGLTETGGEIECQ